MVALHVLRTDAAVPQKLSSRGHLRICVLEARVHLLRHLRALLLYEAEALLDHGLLTAELPELPVHARLRHPERAEGRAARGHVGARAHDLLSHAPRTDLR